MRRTRTAHALVAADRRRRSDDARADGVRGTRRQTRRSTAPDAVRRARDAQLHLVGQRRPPRDHRGAHRGLRGRAREHHHRAAVHRLGRLLGQARDDGRRRRRPRHHPDGREAAVDVRRQRRAARPRHPRRRRCRPRTSRRPCSAPAPSTARSTACPSASTPTRTWRTSTCSSSLGIDAARRRDLVVGRLHRDRRGGHRGERRRGRRLAVVGLRGRRPEQLAAPARRVPLRRGRLARGHGVRGDARRVVAVPARRRPRRAARPTPSATIERESAGLAESFTATNQSAFGPWWSNQVAALRERERSEPRAAAWCRRPTRARARRRTTSRRCSGRRRPRPSTPARSRCSSTSSPTARKRPTCCSPSAACRRTRRSASTSRPSSTRSTRRSSDFLDEIAPARRRRPAGDPPGRWRDRDDHRPAHPAGAVRRADARGCRGELHRGAAAGARRRRHLADGRAASARGAARRPQTARGRIEVMRGPVPGGIRTARRPRSKSPARMRRATPDDVKIERRRRSR